MKMPFRLRLLTLPLALLLNPGTVSAQGNFENLDFSSTTVPTSTPAGTIVPASEALPNWTVYVGGIQQSEVLYNQLYLGTAIVALEGPGFASGPTIPGSTYMCVLQAGTINDQPTSASIAQTATIPPSTSSLLFVASLPYGPGWSVTLGGQNLSIIPLGSDGVNYEYYGANISSYAGQTETLQFTALIGAPTVNMYLDDIQFSNQQIPEPQIWTLLLCGAGALAAWRRKQTP
jgi:hypothetical protein